MKCILNISCLYPKEIHQSMLLLWNNEQWLLAINTPSDRQLVVLL